MSEILPGTLWLNRGRWNWKVRLPGTAVRKNYPLRMPGQDVALTGEKDRSLAASIAWRMWERSSKAPGAHDRRMTLDAAAGAFLKHAETYYRRADGSSTREAVNCELALRSLRARFGSRPLDDLTYQNVLEAREDLIGRGLNRATINQRTGIWRRFAAWALENRLCQPATKAEVWALTPLKRGRSAAPEGEPVRPVRHLDVKRCIAFMPANLRAMVLVQELCGARPSEMCTMRPCDIERRRDVWVYRPATHKTQHKDSVRVIVLGPRAQKILAPLLTGNAYECVFRPERGGGDRWTTSNYGQAIRYAIKASQKAGMQVAEWSPNQLRHACGTRVRRKLGPEAAAAVLGHSRGASRITDRYTAAAMERELILAAARPMRLVG